MKRGRYNRPFLHIAAIATLALGVFITPVVADTFPLFAAPAGVDKLPAVGYQEQSIAVDASVFQTNNSAIRDKTIKYTVDRGDTLSNIARKFGISVGTIKWANNLDNESLSIGQELNILPVTGIEYKVEKGDTVYSIAKKFASNAQKIVDWPFNEFANPETFSLVDGQKLIVPDGIQPAAQPFVKQQPVYFAGGQNQLNFSGGGFNWPLQGIITQGFSLYHPGIDIAGPIGTPIYAAKTGVVAEASCGWNYGYGCHVLLKHANGFSTMYAHMVQQPSVSVGQSVNGGQLLGYRGSTGRSTGPHTHFEIRTPHGNVNPLSYLP